MNSENIKQDKISVENYIENNALLEIVYTPFDKKMEIVSHVLTGIINSLGGLNTALLRRISTEVFIEAISNIDMSIVDENELSGYDQLCFKNELENLIIYLGSEYIEFEKILSERVSDYIRTETNPAVTINAIYKQVSDYFSNTLDYLSDRIQDVDIEEVANDILQIATDIKGDQK